MASQRPRLGQILLAKKLITELELKTALRQQERFGGRVGTILAKLGHITETDLVQILSEVFRVPIVHLQSSRAQAEAINLIPVQIAKKHKILPLRVEVGGGGRRTLHVALSEPQNAAAIDEIRFLTEISSIQTYLAPPGDLERAISNYYDHPQTAQEDGGLGVPVPDADGGKEMVIVRSHADEEVLIDGDQGVAGRLADMGLTDIVQVLGAGGKTVRVQLTSRGHIGDMYLDEGQIVHAECGALKGERAFFEMLDWADGNFTILPQPTPPARTITVSNDGLILEGLRQQDERGEQRTEEDGISFMPVSEAGLEVETIQVETTGNLHEPAEPSLVTSAPSPGPPAGDAAPATADPTVNVEQLKRLLGLLVKKGVISEAEARAVFFAKPK